MQTLPSATSAAKVPALPESWAEQIFRRLENFYGAKFADSLGGIPRERVKQAWAEELADYAAPEIKRGLESCRSRTWPPTLPEFLMLCRPLNDARADWSEACEQMALRLRDGSDQWSRPQVYWAALAIGAHDLHTLAYDQAKARWQRALDNAKSDPIPALVPALPAPGAQSVSKDEALRRTAQLAEQVAASMAGRAGKKWALDLLRKEASGQPVANVAAGAWREPLGFDKGITAADAVKQLEQNA